MAIQVQNIKKKQIIIIINTYACGKSSIYIMYCKILRKKHTNSHTSFKMVAFIIYILCCEKNVCFSFSFSCSILNGRFFEFCLDFISFSLRILHKTFSSLSLFHLYELKCTRIYVTICFLFVW